MKYYIIILFMAITANCRSQISIPIIGYTPDMGWGQIFSKFKYPNLPSSIYDRYKDTPDFYDCGNSTISVLIAFQSDKNRMVNISSIQPLYSISGLPDTSFVWKEIIDSIVLVSIDWRVKEIKYAINESMDSSVIKHYTAINEGKRGNAMKPFACKDRHLMILSFTLPCTSQRNTDFLYQITIKPPDE